MAVCCSVWQCVTVCGFVLQFVAVCCNVLQCVAVCCRSFLGVSFDLQRSLLCQSLSWVFFGLSTSLLTYLLYLSHFDVEFDAEEGSQRRRRCRCR